MKVWLDDERRAPLGWEHVYWPDEAIEHLKSGRVTHISLDHDLGDDSRGTGYDVLLWMEEQVAMHGWYPPVMMVHSANPVAVLKMQRAIGTIFSLLAKR